MRNDRPPSFRQHHLETQSRHRVAFVLRSRESFPRRCDGQIRTKDAGEGHKRTCVLGTQAAGAIEGLKSCVGENSAMPCHECIENLVPDSCNMIHVCAVSSCPLGLQLISYCEHLYGLPPPRTPTVGQTNKYLCDATFCTRSRCICHGEGGVDACPHSFCPNFLSHN